MSKLIKYLVLVLLILNYSCEKEDNAVNYDFDFKIKPVGENQVTIEWEGITEGENIRFVIDTDSNFLTPVIDSEASTESNASTLSGLEPVTDYFIKIEVQKSNEVIWSNIEEFTSFYTVEPVKYNSTDDVEICATLSYVSSKITSNSRTAIFLHEFMKSKSSWGVTFIKDTLIREGYLCVAIDFRGHGCSVFSGELTSIIEIPTQLREDFDATLEFLETIELERSGEIVIFGASMGACVATMVSTYDNVLGGVAASAVESISRDMANVPFAPKGIYYLAGELDKNEAQNIDFEQDAIRLYNSTNEPKQYEIIQDSPAHGVTILEGDNELITKAINWVRNL